MENQRNSSSSSFLFGLLLGAIIGAVIAIYIYKNKKSKVFSDFQKYFNNYLKKITSGIEILPKDSPDVTPTKVAPVAAKPRPKMFVKK
jgi:gas vesicle protein